MGQFVHSSSGDNNLVPFHLWLRDTELKSKIIAKDFAQDCTRGSEPKNDILFWFQIKDPRN